VLIPPNPQVSAEPVGIIDPQKVRIGESLVNWSLRAGGYRGELKTAVSNTVKFGRGPMKTTWDATRDMPVTRFVDVRNYFFDRTAQRWDAVKYEIEATLLSKSQMRKKVESGFYKAESLARQEPDRYPQWLLPAGRREHDNLKDYQPWYLVWEVYDREEGKVLHFLPNNGEPILESDLTYRPYDMLTFNYNGEDVGGISEIGLILPNAEEYNWTETFLLNILRFGIPGTFYDSAITTNDKVVKALQAPLGSYIPLQVPGNRTLAESFMSRPMPVYPPIANDMLAKKRDSISFVSALSDATRGQTVGAKTATELAFIEGNTKNRLRPRQSQVDELTESVSQKQLLLMSRYMSKPKVAKLTGSTDFTEISPWDVDGVEASFKMSPYSPMESNKAVKLEQLRNMQPMFQNNPYVKQGALTRRIFELMEETDLVYTDAEVAAQAAQQPPGGTAAPGGAPAGSPAVAPAQVSPNVAEAPSDLPPRSAGFSDTVNSPPGAPATTPGA
jgi:hypothetical protein